MSYSAHILVIDDERGMLTTLVGILEDEGYSVGACQNGAEALEYLESGGTDPPIDVVISDLRLTDMSGLAILTHLKKVNSNAAFILITAHATVETAIDALNQGAFAYHVKPLDINALSNSIHNALTQRALVLENRNLLERVQQSEVKYRTLVEQAADGIFMAEPSCGRFIEVNPKMADLSGYHREMLLDMGLPTLHPEPERTRVMEMLKRTQEQGYAAMSDLSFQKESGEQVSIDLNSSLMEFEGRRVILGIARDATERKATERRLQETSKLVSLGQLAAGVAHEINNPLTVISGFSQILLNEALPEHVAARLQEMFSEAQRAARIVENLLSFARRHDPEKRYVDLTSILDKTLELKAHDFKLSNIQITRQWPPDLPWTMADEHQLIELILNLLINAEQAMTEAHDEGDLAISVEQIGDRLRISVADNGPGISPENLQKIFDPFFTTKGVGRGTGLGLSICYGIVRQHGGEIWAKSTLGSGTTFYIELPILGPEGGAEADQPEADQEPVPEKYAHVLVVDDEPNIRNLLSSLLYLESCTVDVADDGREAWDRLGRENYDCILLDLKMPGMSGQQLYRLIEESDRELAKKIIFITGDTVSPEASTFIESTGNPSFTKPFDVKELRKEILKSLADSKERSTSLLSPPVSREELASRSPNGFVSPS